MEEAYIKEFNSFNTFWEKKEKEFEANSRRIEGEFMEKQKTKYDQFIERIGRDSHIKKNCITHDVLNLQRIELALAKQKKYIEAQNTRLEWQDLIKKNFSLFKTKAEQQKVTLIEDFEKKQKAEVVEFQKRLEELREDQIRIRKSELEKLIYKYDKLKKELDGIHSSERKALEKDLPIMLNDGNVLMSAKPVANKTISDKKKFLMQKINRLDHPQLPRGD